MLGALSGDLRGAVGDPDDVASEIPQDVQIRGVIDGMPMADLGDSDAFWDGHGGPLLLGLLPSRGLGAIANAQTHLPT